MYNRRMVGVLAQYFAEHGLPKSHEHFKRDGNKPYSAVLVQKKVGGWPIVLKYIKENHPEYWELAQPKVEVEPEEKDPLEALRASTTEKTYE